MRRPWLALLITAAVGLAGAAVSLSGYSGEPGFVYAQQHPARFGPSQLEAIILGTNEPLPSGQGSRAAVAHCEAGNEGVTLNPWHCNVRYMTGSRIVYEIRIEGTGRFRGADATGARVIRGCCLRGAAVRRG